MSFLSVSTASAVWKKCIPVSFLFSRFLILKTFAETLWLAFPPFSHHFLIRNGRALRIFFSAKKFEEGSSESLYYLAIIPSRIYAIIFVIKTSQELRMLSRSLSLFTCVYYCLLVSTSVY